MDYLLNPETGKEVTWYEKLAWIGSGSYTVNMLAAEQYTRQVYESRKIDQTLPSKGIGLKGLIIIVVIILSIFYFIVKPLILKRK